MCGIAGLIGRTGANDATLAAAMTRALRHRGPDDAGVWADAEAGIALGHRRLSIIDLSPMGHQPMHSADGRYVIAFNGEIYNYQALRGQLADYPYRGHSDTEVMLAAFCAWGVERAVQSFNGMFAFALWDCQEHVLYLSRDRLGEKPLYYGWLGKTFLFGSELKALRAHPAFQAEINRDALALYLRHNYVPTPYSIYRDVYKLPPATFLKVGAAANLTNPEPVAYWSARETAERGVRRPFEGSPEEARDQLNGLLGDAVKLRMVADVPLGVFLSGGVDSSTIVALMQAQSNRPVRSFTIGFHDATYNEAGYAKAVARHLGTDHTELYVTPEEAMAVIPRLATLYDEPFADSSQIPTFLVSQLARRHVTVSLSGDGGDELFGGYNRYSWWRGVWRWGGWMPRPLRTTVAAGLLALPPRTWNGVFQKTDRFLPGQLKVHNPGEKIHKLAEAVSVDSPRALYTHLISHWKSPAVIVRDATEPPTTVTTPASWAEVRDHTCWMMYLDLVTYLPDDILVKLDRASMGVSLEGRVPLLDHRVVEFAWQLPLAFKVRDGKSKWLLRQVLYQYVPQELIERPKTGFGVPIDSWLRGPLRDWAESLLEERRLAQEGFFDPAPIRQKWVDHLSGRFDWHHSLWDILMFQAWHHENCR
jgi:asparagine synthase (glutamine-hydrolysing)